MTDTKKPTTTVSQDVAALRAVLDGQHATHETPAEVLAEIADRYSGNAHLMHYHARLSRSLAAGKVALVPDGWVIERVYDDCISITPNLPGHSLPHGVTADSNDPCEKSLYYLADALLSGSAAAEAETRDEKIARVRAGLREQASRLRDPIELAQEIHGTAPRETFGDVLAAQAGGTVYTVECVHFTTQEGTCFFEVKTDDPPESGAVLYIAPPADPAKASDTVSLSTAVTLVAATADMYESAKASGSAPVAWMIRCRKTGEVFWDETGCIWHNESEAKQAAADMNAEIDDCDMEAFAVYATPPASAPEVTTEMVEMARQGYFDAVGGIVSFKGMRAALTAALQQQEGKSHG